MCNTIEERKFIYIFSYYLRLFGNCPCFRGVSAWQCTAGKYAFVVKCISIYTQEIDSMNHLHIERWRWLLGTVILDSLHKAQTNSDRSSCLYIYKWFVWSRPHYVTGVMYVSIYEAELCRCLRGSCNFHPYFVFFGMESVSAWNRDLLFSGVDALYAYVLFHFYPLSCKINLAGKGFFISII